MVQPNLHSPIRFMACTGTCTLLFKDALMRYKLSGQLDVLTARCARDETNAIFQRYIQVLFVHKQCEVRSVPWKSSWELSFLSNQIDALIIQIYSVINSTCFGHLLCPSSGVFYCTFGCGKFHAGFWWQFPSRVRMEHRDSAWKRSLETCMKLTRAECTVENSWWWAEKVPETCRVL